MSIAETLADDLARDTILTIKRLCMDRLFSDVDKVGGASSSPLRDACLTLIRVLLAEWRRGLFLRGTLRAGAQPTFL